MQMGETKGLSRSRNARGRSPIAGHRLSLRFLGRLASESSVRIRTELAIQPPKAYVSAIIDKGSMPAGVDG
jgi:hypothetical protein